MISIIHEYFILGRSSTIYIPMTSKNHNYSVTTAWTGNLGVGTLDYKSYNRNHESAVEGKEHVILGSSDPAFGGDICRYNPEELLVSSVSSCHMLWYLHLCSVNKIVVVDYVDQAKGVMIETADGSGAFDEITLYPVVTVQDQSMIDKANALHVEANKMCFIANSCNFKIGP